MVNGRSNQGGAVSPLRRKYFFALLAVSVTSKLGACGGGAGSVGSKALPLIDNPRVLASPEGDEVVFAATDPSNPLSIYRRPITRRLQVLALDLAQGTESTLHAIDRFMTYIDDFAVGYASVDSPDATVLERTGACGTFTGVFLAMARCLGISGRYITMANYPENDGHAACELYIDGRWMFFDATAHSYYLLPWSEGIPLSYEDTRYGYRNGLPVSRVGWNSRFDRDLYSGPDIFINANPQGVIGPENPLRYPLSLDFSSKPVMRREDFTAVNQGSIYIGAGDTNVLHAWHLTGLQVGAAYRFVMEPYWMGGDLDGSDLTFFLSSELFGGTYLNNPIASLDFSNGEVEPYVVEFTARDAKAILNVSHPYRGPAWRYVLALEYRLEAV